MNSRYVKQKPLPSFVPAAIRCLEIHFMNEICGMRTSNFVYTSSSSILLYTQYFLSKHRTRKAKASDIQHNVKCGLWEFEKCYKCHRSPYDNSNSFPAAMFANWVWIERKTTRNSNTTDHFSIEQKEDNLFIYFFYLN